MFIPNETIASLEAVLFACGGPVEGERLRELLGLSPEELSAAAEELEKALADNNRGIMLTGLSRATPPSGGVAQNLLFTEEGIWLGDHSGLYTDKSGDVYYLDKGIALAPGVVQDEEGNFYYISTSMKATRNTTRTIRADLCNGLLDPRVEYIFDNRGVILNPVAPPEEPDYTKNGLTWDEDGEIRFYVNGEAIIAGVVQDADGNYYYIGTDRVAVKNASRTIREDLCNGLLSPHYVYNFDENGIITNPVPVEGGDTPEKPENPVEPDFSKEGLTWDDDGEIRFYVDGLPVAAGVVQDAEGNYYYISSDLVAAKNTSRTIREDHCNGLLSPHFTYVFDENGVITNPVPLVNVPDGPVEPDLNKTGLYYENGGLYYYVKGQLTHGGLIFVDGDFYYINSAGMAVCNETRYIEGTWLNKLLPAGDYSFGEDYKMILD